MPKKKAKKRASKKASQPKKRAPRTGQKKLQFTPLGCEFIVEGLMSECDLTKSEALRHIVWQWYWLIGDNDRPVIIIQTPDPGSTYEQKSRKSLTKNLGTANKSLHKGVEALKRYTTELHDPEDAQDTLENLKQLAGKYSELYNETRSGIVLYLHHIPPEIITEALKIDTQGGTTAYTKLVLANLFKDGIQK